MNVKIIAAIVLFSFPVGLIIAGLVLAVNKKIKGDNMNELIKAIKALCSFVFAEEFSLEGININDRDEVVYNFIS